MVSADEIHHLGRDNKWGQSFEDAFELSTVRLLTTGTPFRSDGGKIPWTTVRGDQLVLAGAGAYSYGYKEALQEGEVVREVEFHSWDGTVGWRSPDGQTDYTHEIKEDSVRRTRTCLPMRFASWSTAASLLEPTSSTPATS